MRKLIAVILLLMPQLSFAIEGIPYPEALIKPLMESLLQDIKNNTTFRVPEERPKVFFSSIVQLSKAYCNLEEPCNVAAVTDSDTGNIYIRSNIALNNTFNISIFYHELIHFIQIKNNMYRDLKGCYKWAAAETQAYKAQSDWLTYKGFKGFVVPDLAIHCLE